MWLDRRSFGTRIGWDSVFFFFFQRLKPTWLRKSRKKIPPGSPDISGGGWWWEQLGESWWWRMVVMEGKHHHERTRGREGVICKKEAGWWCNHEGRSSSFRLSSIIDVKQTLCWRCVITQNHWRIHPHFKTTQSPFFPHKKWIRGCFTAVAPCVRLLGPLWGRAVIPEGTYESVQFTSRWEAAFTAAHKTLRGPRIHLPISPILLTLARRTSGWSEKDGPLSPVLDNIPSDTTVGLLSPQAPENLPSLIYAKVLLRLIPGVHVLHSGGGRWSKNRSTQWYWETWRYKE